jgi:histidinol-phosphatase
VTGRGETRGGRRARPAGATDATSSLLHAVADLARLAGDVALGYFDSARRSALPIEYKADGSPVTAADRGAEAAAREWIERHFRLDGILGEELGAVRPGARRRWVLDPIDGTKSFVRGVPLWGTLVAVAEGEAVLAGAIYCAAVGELVAAAVGQGCWWNGVRCRVSAEDRLAEATVLTTDDRFLRVTADPAAPPAWVRAEQERLRLGWHRVADRAAIARTWGDCYGYLLVATGRAEVMMDAVMAPWDTAALYPVITEAGGVLTDWEGVPTAFGGSSVATNLALAAQVRALLRAGDRPYIRERRKGERREE